MLSACVGRKRERASGWGREEEEAVISLKCRVCRLIVLLTSSKITARHKKKDRGRGLSESYMDVII